MPGRPSFALKSQLSQMMFLQSSRSSDEAKKEAIAAQMRCEVEAMVELFSGLQNELVVNHNRITVRTYFSIMDLLAGMVSLDVGAVAGTHVVHTAFLTRKRQ